MPGPSSPSRDLRITLDIYTSVLTRLADVLDPHDGDLTLDIVRGLPAKLDALKQLEKDIRATLEISSLADTLPACAEIRRELSALESAATDWEG